MTAKVLKYYLIGLAAMVLAACGGGGGGGGSEPPIIEPPPIESALEFTQPSSFANGAAHVTAAASTAIRGGLRSAFMPRGLCPDRPLPQNYSLRWSNAANGDSGTAPIGFGCITSGGSPGIVSVFEIESVALAPGNNRITLESFEGATQFGRDTITIIREDRAPPTVSLTYPADAQTGVPLDAAIVVVFSERMNVASLTADRFVVEDAAATPVSGQASYEEASLAWTFRPDAPLTAETSYTATVSGSVEDAGGSNTLGADYSWAFTTGTTSDTEAPVLSRQWPGTGCDCASGGTRILAGFNKILDPASVDAAALSVTTSGAPVSGTTVYHGDYLEFEPDEPLTAGTTYAVAVAAGVRDLAGTLVSAGTGWQFTTDARTPAGSWSATSDDQPPPAMAGATAVWSGTEVLVWGFSGGGRYDPAANIWSATTSIGAGGPSARFGHSATWTGTDMIAWGGRSSVLDDAEIFVGGGTYDPIADAWTEIGVTPTSTSFATYDHAAVWTGTELIVWGGIARANGTDQQPVNSGWRYDTLTGNAVAFTGTGAPSARSQATAVWTGSEMIVWGGFDADGLPLADGARYNPVADAWTPLPPLPAGFAPGIHFSAVWTGSEMVVWNGGKTADDQVRNDRFRAATLHFYDPLTDSWRASASGWEPFLAVADPIVMSFVETGYAAFWTGDRMFVAARNPAAQSYLYDPVLDSWQAVTDTAGLSRRGAAQVWAGSRFVTWGGVANVLPLNDGLVLDP